MRAGSTALTPRVGGEHNVDVADRCGVRCPRGAPQPGVSGWFVVNAHAARQLGWHGLQGPHEDIQRAGVEPEQLIQKEHHMFIALRARLKARAKMPGSSCLSVRNPTRFRISE